ncbi:MAG: ABC transporter substrate-binding protein [Nitrospinota bacterium]
MHHLRVGMTLWVAALSTAFLLLVWPQTSWGQQKERVTLKWAWLYGPTVAPFFVGIEKGFFAAEGIDLDFPDGRGSVKNVQFLSAKKVLFAIADLATAAKFISQGAPVKAVWGYMQTSPMSVIAQEGLGVRSPKDLEGRKIGAAAGDAGKAIFPALAKLNAVDVSKIKFVNVTFAARNTSFLNGDVDAIIAFFPDNVPFLRSKGAEVSFLRYADFGVNTLSQGVNVHESVLTEKADTLRRLLRGVSRSVKYSQTHLDETIAALQKRAPLSMKDPVVARGVLKSVLSLGHTENSRGKPLGWMARKDWEQTIDILTNYGGVKKALPPERYYTNDFVPKDIM